MPPYQKTKKVTRNTKAGKVSMTPKEKDKQKSNPPSKRTIGPGLISEMLDSKKETLNKIEISKKAFENLQDHARSKGVPIEQVVTTLIEQHFNPRYKKNNE
jgi:hypothetical protein